MLVASHLHEHHRGSKARACLHEDRIEHSVSSPFDLANRRANIVLALFLHAGIVLAVTILVTAAPAYADDGDLIGLPAKEAARLVARDVELDAVRLERDALKAVVAAQDAQIKAQAALIVTQDAMLTRQERLTALADEETAIFKARAERASKGDKWKNAQAKAGLAAIGCVPFAVAGGPFAPAIPLVCGLVGGVYGYVSGGP